MQLSSHRVQHKYADLAGQTNHWKFDGVNISISWKSVENDKGGLKFQTKEMIFGQKELCLWEKKLKLKLG